MLKTQENTLIKFCRKKVKDMDYDVILIGTGAAARLAKRYIDNLGYSSLAFGNGRLGDLAPYSIAEHLYNPVPILPPLSVAKDFSDFQELSPLIVDKSACVTEQIQVASQTGSLYYKIAGISKVNIDLNLLRKHIGGICTSKSCKELEKKILRQYYAHVSTEPRMYHPSGISPYFNEINKIEFNFIDASISKLEFKSNKLNVVTDKGNYRAKLIINTIPLYNLQNIVPGLPNLSLDMYKPVFVTAEVEEHELPE